MKSQESETRIIKKPEELFMFYMLVAHTCTDEKEYATYIRQLQEMGLVNPIHFMDMFEEYTETQGAKVNQTLIKDLQPMVEYALFQIRDVPIEIIN